MQKLGYLYLNQSSRNDREESLACLLLISDCLLSIKTARAEIFNQQSEISNQQYSSRPTVPCDGPRMNPSVDVGNPPRPFRHLRMAERRTPDPSSSRVPVHSALVQKSVTVITNPAGRLSLWMLGELSRISKRANANSWQNACNQSNLAAALQPCNRSGYQLKRLKTAGL
jgi:hypothetical protein